MIRGEIFDVRFPAGRRPAVIVTRDVAIPILANLTVVPLTTRPRGIPSEVPLGREQGLVRDCIASCDNFQTVAKANVGDSIGHLGPEKLRALDDAIRIALDLD